MRSQRESGTNEKNIVCHTFFVLMLSVSGCGAGIQTEEDNPIPIVDKIYMNNSPLSEKTLDFDFLKFYDDGTFQGIDPMYLLTY